MTWWILLPNQAPRRKAADLQRHMWERQRGKGRMFSSRACRKEIRRQLFFLKTGLSRGVPLTAFGDFCPYKSHPSETDTSYQIDGAFIAAPAARQNLNKAINSDLTIPPSYSLLNKCCKQVKPVSPNYEIFRNFTVMLQKGKLR